MRAIIMITIPLSFTILSELVMKLKRIFYLACMLLLIVSCEKTPSQQTVFPTAITSVATSAETAGVQDVSWTQVSFDNLAPAGIDMQQCWNSLGMDDQGRIYIGFTSVRADNRDDFVVFRYDPITGGREFLGTFLDVVAEAGNVLPGESIPKGHTRMIFADGKMYMGTQSFHDLKWSIDSLPSYRGSHLLAFDTISGTWQDLSAALPGGVVTEHEGIISLNILRKEHLLVGLAHPSSDIVLYDYQNEQLVKVVPGIPWKLGNPLSREVIVTPDGHIYTYRGTEDPSQRHEKHDVWVYDLATGEMKDTGYAMTNGFWIGQTEKRDGSKIFVSTTGGELYEFDVASETFTDPGYMLPADQITAGREIQYTYAITLSPDETVIYIALSVIANPEGSGELYAYDLGSGKLTFVRQLPVGIYTSADIRDSQNIYFSHFGEPGNIWSGDPRLFILHVPGTSLK
jgi:hypothetical protein